MSNCFIYCRKSSEDKGKQIISLDDQERIGREVASDKGFKIVKIFRESKSARRPNKRPDFHEMLSRIKKGEGSIVVCWKADRLCRNAQEGGELIDRTDYKGLTIVTPTMEYSRSNSTFLFIEFGMATQFSKDLSDNVKRGLQSKLQMGWRPGEAPLGYLNDKDKPKGLKSISPDPERFKLCRKWWEMMLSGKYTVEDSLEEITAMGLFSKRTKRPVSKTQAFRFFRDIFYVGLFDFKDERYKGSHKPMITMSEYNRVQIIINGRNREHKQQRLLLYADTALWRMWVQHYSRKTH